jgi:hypothetical protein
MATPSETTLSTASAPSPSPSAHKGPSNIKVGGIPLPAFIVICMFGPFFLSFIFFLLWLQFVKKPRDKRQLADEARIEAGKQEVEMQLRGLVEQDPNIGVPRERV